MDGGRVCREFCVCSGSVGVLATCGRVSIDLPAPPPGESPCRVLVRQKNVFFIHERFLVMFLHNNNHKASGLIYSSLVVLAAMLSACGGGGESTPTTPTTPGVSTGAESSGTVAIEVFTPKLNVLNTAATVAYNTTTKVGSITFNVDTTPQSVSTTDGYDKDVKFSGFATSGAFKANGNFMMICPAAKQESTHVVVTANLKRVTDFAPLRGKFNSRTQHCGGQGDGILSFNSDGSLSVNGALDFSAAQVTAMYTDAGLNPEPNWNIKARAYSYTNSAGGVRYYVVLMEKENNNTWVHWLESQ